MRDLDQSNDQFTVVLSRKEKRKRLKEKQKKLKRNRHYIGMLNRQKKRMYNTNKNIFETLTQFGLNNDVIKYILNFMRAETFIFNGNNEYNINHIRPLRCITNLIRIVISNTEIHDLSSLKYLTNLKSLNIFKCKINDITSLSRLTNLKTIYMPYNNIVDITPLSKLTNLKAICMAYNNIVDITPLSGLTNLIDIAMPHNNIVDITPLRGLTNLKIARFNNNQILCSLESIITIHTLSLNQWDWGNNPLDKYDYDSEEFDIWWFS